MKAQNQKHQGHDWRLSANSPTEYESLLSPLFILPKPSTEWIISFHITEVNLYYVISALAQSCPSLCHSLDCRPPGCSVHGIFRARTLEWVAISSSGGSSWLRDWSSISTIAGGLFTAESSGKAVLPHPPTQMLISSRAT